jgi:hypothetical protein
MILAYRNFPGVGKRFLSPLYYEADKKIMVIILIPLIPVQTNNTITFLRLGEILQIQYSANLWINKFCRVE